MVRLAGTYTQQPIDIVIAKTVTLYGLDQQPTSPFTVADNSGNQYQLLTTQTLTASTDSATTISNVVFQSSLIGPVSSPVNTITTVISVTNGVSSVNNSATYTLLGQNEETDAQLRLRRSNSVSLPSKGYLAGLYGGLLSISGVTYVNVQENTTNIVTSTLAGGIPPHSIWVIVATASALTTVQTNGLTLADNIAQVIYNKRNAGCGQTNSGSGASGTAVLSGSTLGSITLGSGGSGYYNAPLVTITGGGGTGATATAAFSATTGQITGFTVVTAGTGYTSVPTVNINPNTNVYPITQVDGTTFNIYWDSPILKPIYFSATVTHITGNVPTNLSTQIANAVKYSIGQSADASSIVALIKALAPNCYVSSEQISTISGGSGSYIAAPGYNYQFTLPVGNISITAI